MSKLDCTFKTLLPHPSKVELALEEEMSGKYCRSNVDILRDLYNPMACPLDFLPWLAYALSVDVWNPNWPEYTKRSVVQNSLMMHVHKGTIGGTEDAFLAMGIQPDITEWWQKSPPGRRGTMTVMLWLHQNLNPNAAVIFSKEILQDLMMQLDRSKRASIHYAFQVGVNADSGIGVASSGQAGLHQRADALHKTTEINAKPPVNFGLGHSGQVGLHQRINADSLATSVRALANLYRIGLSGQFITHLKLEAIL